MLTNYHTHCNMCGHAGGTVEDYIVAAIDNQFEILGMSDHMPYPDREFGARMAYSDKDIYLDEISRVKSQYDNKIKIYGGFEAEYLPEYNYYYEELLKDERCDYLIMGQHFFIDRNGELQYVYDIKNTEQYVDYALASVEGMRTGYFKYMCHPDFIGVGNFAIDDNHLKAFDIIVEGAIKYGVPLEYNANGLRRGTSILGGVERYQYPLKQLWDMVEGTETKVMVGSDAHNPKLLYDEGMQQALDVISKGNFCFIR